MAKQWDDLVGLPRTLQLRVNYSTGGNDEKEKEVQQGIQAGRRSTDHLTGLFNHPSPISVVPWSMML